MKNIYSTSLIQQPKRYGGLNEGSNYTTEPNKSKCSDASILTKTKSPILK